MIIRFLKQIAAPIVFSKGLAQSQKGQYGIAMQLYSKAGQWMPSLATDALYLAAIHLCDHHLNNSKDTLQTQSILDGLMASPHKDTTQYTEIISEVKKILNAEPPANEQ